MRTTPVKKEDLIRDPKALQAKVVECFLPLNPERIILFGSAGRGEMDEYSDVDVIMVMPTRKRFLDRLTDAYLCWTLPFGADILVYTPEEFQQMVEDDNALVCEAMTHGKVLYERSSR